MLIARCNANKPRLLCRISCKDMGADVGVLVRSIVVAVQIERTVVLVLVVVTAAIEHDAGRVVVRVVAQSRTPQLMVWKSRLLIVVRKDMGKGTYVPLVPHAPSTPKRCALKVIFGDGSRCRRSGTKHCCRRPDRTHRSSGPGCSYRRHRARRRTRCSTSCRSCMSHSCYQL